MSMAGVELTGARQVTTSDDPNIRALASKGAGTVFATGAVTCLVCGSAYACLSDNCAATQTLFWRC